MIVKGYDIDKFGKGYAKIEITRREAVDLYHALCFYSCHDESERVMELVEKMGDQFLEIEQGINEIEDDER